MRVVLAGQKWFGEAVGNLLVSLGIEVALVVTPKGDRLEDFADRHELSCEPELRNIPQGCDLILCAHHHGFISQELREQTRYGALGFHPSLLPRHLGRDAIEWAIRFGDPVTGGTVYWFDDRADAGPIAAQEAVHIPKNITAAELWREHLQPLGLKLFKRVLRNLQNGIVIAEAQNEDLATWEPRIESKRLAEHA